MSISVQRKGESLRNAAQNQNRSDVLRQERYIPRSAQRKKPRDITAFIKPAAAGSRSAAATTGRIFSTRHAYLSIGAEAEEFPLRAGRFAFERLMQKLHMQHMHADECLKRESGVSEGKWESGKVLKCGRDLNVC